MSGSRHALSHLNTLWLLLCGSGLLFLAFNPGLLRREVIAGFLDSLGPGALLVYVLLSLSRAALLLPATPFVLAGGLVFPGQPLLVFAVSLAGIAAGALLVYSFPSIGGYRVLLEEKFPRHIGRLKERMAHRHVYWFIAGWSAFPLVPTDAVCYAAGIVRLSAARMVTAVLAGELPIVAFYVLAGVGLGEWLRT